MDCEGNALDRREQTGSASLAAMPLHCTHDPLILPLEYHESCNVNYLILELTGDEQADFSALRNSHPARRRSNDFWMENRRTARKRGRASTTTWPAAQQHQEAQGAQGWAPLSGAVDEPDRGGGGGVGSPLTAPEPSTAACGSTPPPFTFTMNGVPPDTAALDMDTPATTLNRRLTRAASKLGVKDVLCTRKRQLTTVLGALLEGDTQALEASWPLGSAPADDVQHMLEPFETRMSKGLRVRAACRPRQRRSPPSIRSVAPDLRLCTHPPSTNKEVNTVCFLADLARQASKTARPSPVAALAKAPLTPPLPLDCDRKLCLRPTKKSGAGDD
ncbi:hypothetical protein BD626DRAFT_564059 [Schizophyllum amplum]|uniref:Uncharacterized protein n=1 Tax=Schizophyllum amplum TaxID=97359 RepID=A0A550D050_9AGAR|nr:hypothetical protein BD626DRAFT_564059 [Auriculariopsis ampla]